MYRNSFALPYKWAINATHSIFYGRHVVMHLNTVYISHYFWKVYGCSSVLQVISTDKNVHVPQLFLCFPINER